MERRSVVNLEKVADRRSYDKCRTEVCDGKRSSIGNVTDGLKS